MPDNRQLSDMKLPELKNMAKELGLRGTSTMRKPELVTAIEAAQGANESVEDTIKSSVKSSGNSEGTSADSFGVINRSSDGDFSIRRRNMGDNPILPRLAAVQRLLVRLRRRHRLNCLLAVRRLLRVFPVKTRKTETLIFETMFCAIPA